MTCDKCSDIHKAQLEGKTQQACKCECHIIHINPSTNPTIPYFPTTPTTLHCCRCRTGPLQCIGDCFCRCHGGAWWGIYPPYTTSCNGNTLTVTTCGSGLGCSGPILMEEQRRVNNDLDYFIIDYHMASIIDS